MMTQRRIYIAAAQQISMQQPLSTEWMDAPSVADSSYVRSVEPDYKQYLSPVKSRRMGLLLRRALVTSIQALRDAGFECPQAVVTGSAWGCLENTELFLRSMCEDGERLLKPTHFMQSTHNTISSLISIHLGCHGYNTTYSHRNISFESALSDAMMQLAVSDIDNALVGCHDELTPDWFELISKIEPPRQVPVSETSTAIVLTSRSEKAMCEVLPPTILNRPDNEMLKSAVRKARTSGVDLILAGLNGDPDNDAAYAPITESLPGVPVASFKRICGENYSASAFGTYMAAVCLAQGRVPAALTEDKELRPESILVVNHCGGRNYTLTTLRKCGDYSD